MPVLPHSVSESESQACLSSQEETEEGTASSSWWHFGDLPGQFHWGPRDCRPPKTCRGVVCSCRACSSPWRAPSERPLSTQRGPPRGEVAGPGQSKAQCTWDFRSRRTLGTALRTRGPCPWGHGDAETEEDAGMRVRACAPVRCVWSQSCGRVRRVPGTSSDPSSSVGVLGPFLHLFHLRLGHPCPKVTTQGPPPRGQVGRARRAGRGHATAR